jgi:hypothetical protein
MRKTASRSRTRELKFQCPQTFAPSGKTDTQPRTTASCRLPFLTQKPFLKLVEQLQRLSWMTAGMAIAMVPRGIRCRDGGCCGRGLTLGGQIDEVRLRLEG